MGRVDVLVSVRERWAWRIVVQVREVELWFCRFGIGVGIRVGGSTFAT